MNYLKRLCDYKKYFVEYMERISNAKNGYRISFNADLKK